MAFVAPVLLLSAFGCADNRTECQGDGIVTTITITDKWQQLHKANAVEVLQVDSGGSKLIKTRIPFNNLMDYLIIT